MSYKNLFYLIIIFTLFATPVAVNAQSTPALNEIWRNSDYTFNAVMLELDRHNNVYVVGDTPATNILMIKKFTPDGSLAWQTTYDPPEALRGTWIATDSANSVVVSATIIQASSGQPQGLLTLKYDTNGNLLWVQSLPGAFSGASRMELDTNNNIYIAGFSFNDALLLKYSPSGSLLWSQMFDNNGAIDKAASLAVSPDNNLIAVAGVSGNLFMGLMYDANGNNLWANTDATFYASASVAFGPKNAVYFATGAYLPLDPDPYQMAIVKFNTSGNQIWAENYNVGDKAYRVAVDWQGNVVATGIDQVNGGYTDWMTIKTDADGTLLWSQRYDGGKNNDEVPNMLILGPQNEIYVAGTGGPNPSAGNISYLKGIVAKYGADGTPQWAVWDEYAGGKGVRLENRLSTEDLNPSLVTLGFGYLVITSYDQIGSMDVVPEAPTNLNGVATPGSVVLSFNDNASNEFWVEIERCTGAGCTNFVKIGQTLGENASAFNDMTVQSSTTYAYRVRAMGFMGPSDYSNTFQITTFSKTRGITIES